MTVSSLGSVAAGIERTLPTTNPTISNTVAALVREPAAQVDVSAQAARQSANAPLREAAVNVAQTQATIEVAQNASVDIGGLLTQATALATTAAAPTTTDVQRTALNTEFQGLLQQINTVATSANFNGQNLLDGTFSAEGAGIQIDASVANQFTLPELTSGALLGGQDIAIDTNAASQAARQALAQASSDLAAAQADFASLQSALEFAQASVSTALQNQNAARAAIASIDIAALESNAVQATVAQSPTEAAVAQTNLLPSNVLQLLEN